MAAKGSYHTCQGADDQLFHPEILRCECKALDSVFPVIQCLGQGCHSYKSCVSNFLIIGMIFSNTKISQIWKEIFIKGLTRGKCDQFIAGSKIMQVENTFKFMEFLEGPRSL